MHKSYTSKYAITDVHAHILPGVDDGSQNIEMTRRMLSQSYQQGIRHIIATPHSYEHKPVVELKDKLDITKGIAEEIAEDLTISLGMEIYYTDASIEHLKADEYFTMSGSRYVLVEFSTTCTYQTMLKAVRSFIQARFTPVIAHIERYQCLRREGHIEGLIGIGAILQMNYDSLVGGFLDREAKWCREQVKKGYITMLGTDMHSDTWRKPDIKKALEWLSKHVTEDQYLDLTGREAERMFHS